MKLIWHIVRKDLRRLSVPLLLWGSLFVLHYLAYVNLGTDESGFATFLNSIWGVQMVAAWLLVPQLIHADPLMSDHAAWRTRPVSGARLLGAKLLGLLLMFCLWPALLTLPWWIHFDFSFAQIIGASGANMVGFGLLALAAAGLAASTTEFLRYLAWSFVLFTVAGFGFFTFWAEYPSKSADEVILPALLTRVRLVAGLLVVTSVVVIGMQYLARRARITVAIAAAAFVTSVGVLSLWPWSAADLLARGGEGRFGRPTISFQMANATAFMPPPGKNENAALQLQLAPAVEGVADGDAIGWLAFNGMLGHGEAGRRPTAMDLSGGANSLSLSRASRYLAEAGETDRGRVSNIVGGMVTVPPAVVDRWRTEAGTVEGHAVGILRRGGLLARFPLAAKAGGGKGGRQVHVQTVDDADVHEGAATGWFEMQPAFDPEMLLTAASGGRMRWRSTQAVLTGPNGAVVDGEIGSRPLRIIPVGALALSFHSRSLPLPIRDGRNDLSDFWTTYPPSTGFTIAIVEFDPVVRLSAPAVTARFAPDIVVEGSVEAALRRAQAENKRVLLLWSGREYAVTEQREPPGWDDAQVRALLRTGFVCVRVYEQDKQWFADRDVIESGLVHNMVLTREGTVQDRFSYMGPSADWQAALAANAEGRTYLAHLQDELARTAPALEIEILRQKIARTAMAAGDYEEALTQYLWFAEKRMGNPDWRLVGMSRYSLRQLANHPPTAARLRERHAAALAQLEREPNHVAAAQTLLLTADALRFVAPLWADFPRQLPPDHPERWGLLADWIYAGYDSSTLVVAVLEPEEFFADGRTWVQQRLQKAKGRPAREYAEILRSERWRWAWAGLRCVDILEKTGEPERARRLAREVLKIEATGNMRQRLRSILLNGDTDFLNEISVSER